MLCFFFRKKSVSFKAILDHPGNVESKVNHSLTDAACSKRDVKTLIGLSNLRRDPLPQSVLDHIKAETFEIFTYVTFVGSHQTGPMGRGSS